MSGAANELRNDPRAVQDAERSTQTRAVLTFGELCDLYIAHVKASGKISWKTDEGYLKRPKSSSENDRRSPSPNGS